VLGAIERIRDPTDRRRQRLRPTDEGTRLLTAATATAEKLSEELIAPLNAADRKALTRILERLAAAEGLPTE
jgi:DNA-binding MarR family transcriptional regulator